MPGQSRTVVASPALCQARCGAVVGCAYFSWWPDGGCRLQARTARPQSDSSALAGPKQCGVSFYLREDIGSKSCAALAQGTRNGQKTEAGSVSLAACQAACVARGPTCSYFTWYENNGCRTYSGCSGPVDDIPAVSKHTYQRVEKWERARNAEECALSCAGRGRHFEFGRPPHNCDKTWPNTGATCVCRCVAPQGPNARPTDGYQCELAHDPGYSAFQFNELDAAGVVYDYLPKPSGEGCVWTYTDAERNCWTAARGTCAEADARQQCQAVVGATPIPKEQAYTITSGIKWCSGANDNVGDVWGTGTAPNAQHCPLIGLMRKARAIAQSKALCDSRSTCTAFTFYPSADPPQICFRSRITSKPANANSDAVCYGKVEGDDPHMCCPGGKVPGVLVAQRRTCSSSTESC